MPQYINIDKPIQNIRPGQPAIAHAAVADLSLLKSLNTVYLGMVTLNKATGLLLVVTDVLRRSCNTGSSTICTGAKATGIKTIATKQTSGSSMYAVQIPLVLGKARLQAYYTLADLTALGQPVPTLELNPILIAKAVSIPTSLWIEFPTTSIIYPNKIAATVDIAKQSYTTPLNTVTDNIDLRSRCAYISLLAPSAQYSTYYIMYRWVDEQNKALTRWLIDLLPSIGGRPCRNAALETDYVKILFCTFSAVTDAIAHKGTVTLLDGTTASVSFR